MVGRRGKKGQSSADQFRAATSAAEEATSALDALAVGGTTGGAAVEVVPSRSSEGGKTPLERDVEDGEALQRAYAAVHGTGEGADAAKALGEGSAVAGGDDDEENGGEYENYYGDSGGGAATAERDIRGNPIVRGGAGGGKLAGKAEDQRYAALRSKRRDTREKQKRKHGRGGGKNDAGGGNERESISRGPGGTWHVEKSPTSSTTQARRPSQLPPAAQEKFPKPKHEQEALRAEREAAVSNFLGKQSEASAESRKAATTAVAAAAPAPASAEKKKKEKVPRAPKKLDKFGFILNLDEEGRPVAGEGAGDPGAGGDLPPRSPRRPTKKGGGGDADGGGEEEPTTAKTGARREAKWAAMMDRGALPASRRKRRRGGGKKVKSRARKGVPHNLRGRAWARMGDVPRKINVKYKGVYDELVRKSSGAEYDEADAGAEEASRRAIGAAAAVDAPSPKATMDTIERDLDRTFPRHHMFYDVSDEDSSFSEEESDSDEDKRKDSGDAGSSDSDPSVKADNCHVPAWGAIDEEEDDDVCNDREPNEMDRPSEATGTANGGASDAAGAAACSGFGIGATGKGSVSRVLEVMQEGCNADLDDVVTVASDGQTSVGLNPPPPAAGAGTGAPSGVTSAAAAAGAGGSKGDAKASAGAAARAVPAGRKLSKEERKLARKEAERRDYVAAAGGQASLRRVLRAYAAHDPDVGYCQGMNFIAAMFLTFMEEEEAFWLLVHVMNEEPCRMRGLFGEGMAHAHRVLHVAEGLVQQFLPKLAGHLERENIHVTMYATQWLLTLYASSFPFDLVTRVWDCFLAEGWKIVFRVMLAILDRASPELMQLRFEEILGYFRELPGKIDGDATLDASLKIPLRRRHIEKLEAEWNARQQGR